MRRNDSRPPGSGAERRTRMTDREKLQKILKKPFDEIDYLDREFLWWHQDINIYATSTSSSKPLQGYTRVV
jgi:hypothetical protein